MPTKASIMFGSVPSPPPEFSDMPTFLNFLGISVSELSVIRKHRFRMYNHFEIPKKTGGVRLIDAPNDRLRFLQRRIMDVLVKRYRPRHVVHGFVHGRSSVTNASEHVKRNHILNIDLKDFFPSITEKRVFGLLQTIGVPSDVAKAICWICCVLQRLPQGAPTSPVISNMICLRLDRALMAFCKTRRIRYTRYADDLTFSLFSFPDQLFSGDIPKPGKLDVDKVNTDLISIITENGFDPNPNKVRYFGRNARKEVTGLIVSETINVPRKFIRNIRAVLFDIEHNGYASAQVKFSTKVRRISSLKENLRGKILWVGQVKGISDDVYIRLSKRFNAAFPDATIPVGSSRGEILSLANWVVETDQDTGSAFFLDGFGLVTAFHCVDGASKIEVFHPSRLSKRYAVSIAKSCKPRDLAILSHAIPEDEFRSLKCAGQPPRTGDAVRIIGFPSYGPGSNLQIREAKIVGHQTKAAVKHLVVDGKINQGNSGGPLVDTLDAVVGVAHKGGPKEAIDIAISIQELSGL